MTGLSSKVPQTRLITATPLLWKKQPPTCLQQPSTPTPRP
jgi:hypothetical protein